MEQKNISGDHLISAFPELLHPFQNTKQTASIMTSYEKITPHSLVFIPDKKALDLALSGQAAIIVADEKLKTEITQVSDSKIKKTILLTPELQVVMALIGKKFFPQTVTSYWEGTRVHPTACIDPSAQIHPTATVGPYTVIGAHTVVDEGAVIGSHNILMSDTQIGAQTKIGSHNVIANKVVIGKKNRIVHHCNIEKSVILGDENTIHAFVFIGEQCKIHSFCEIGEHCVLGSDGFGYGTSKQGHHYKKNHYGKVIIHDHVTLGAHNCIDKGTFNDSVIEKGTKVDNFCHFAHNVQVGKHNLITAGFMCAGSTKIGSHCTFGGRTSVTGHVQLSDHVTTGGASVVNRSLKKPGIYGGFPIQNINDFKKNLVASAQLFSWMQKINKKLFPRNSSSTD